MEMKGKGMEMKAKIGRLAAWALACAAAAAPAGAETRRVVLTEHDRAREMSPSFAQFAARLGVDGGSFSNGWKHVCRSGGVPLDAEGRKGAFADPDGKLKATAVYSDWIYRTWVWAGEAGATTSLTVPEAATLPHGRPDFLPWLVDLVTLEAWPLPEADAVRADDGRVTFRNLPVKATPMALATRYSLNLPGSDVRDWKFSAAVAPEDKILFASDERPELVIDVLDRDGRPVREAGATAVLRWYRSGSAYTNELVALDGRQIRRPMSLGRPGAVTCEISFKVPGFIGQVTPRRAVPVPREKESTGHLGADRKSNAVAVRYEDYGRLVGCVFDWDRIRAKRPAPADIDRVWDGLLEEDAKLPFEVKKLEHVRTTKTGVKIYRIVLNSLGGDVHAEMSIPKEAEDGKRFPVWCIFQAYGCASMSTWPWEWAITIAPNAHSIENGREAAYYKRLRDRGGPLCDYGFDEAENAKFETTYFRQMLLRDVRAVRYMMSRPEWNGKEVMFYGSSQGGYQATALLGLIPETTSLSLICPWAVSLGGSQSHWRPKWGEGIQYCDPMNLVHRVAGGGKKVSLRFGVADSACPVDGIFAWLNALPKDVDLMVQLYQNRGHNVPDGKGQQYHVELRRKPGEAAAVIPHFDLPRCYEEGSGAQ